MNYGPEPYESQIMREIQMAASRRGWRLFRNNVGVARTKDGRVIQFGLCVGSADLIGWTNTGRFLAVEVKRRTGRTTGAQRTFLARVRQAGGIGLLCKSVDDFILAAYL